MNKIEIWMKYNEIEPLRGSIRMRHGIEPLRRNSGELERKL